LAAGFRRSPKPKRYILSVRSRSCADVVNICGGIAGGSAAAAVFVFGGFSMMVGKQLVMSEEER
jgi:hypothetical protein